MNLEPVHAHLPPLSCPCAVVVSQYDLHSGRMAESIISLPFDVQFIAAMI